MRCALIREMILALSLSLLSVSLTQVSHKDGEGVDKNPHRLSAVMSDIHLMKGRQEGIANVLEALKQ